MFGLPARRSLFARLSRRLHIGQVGDQAQLALQKSVTKSLRDVVHSKSGQDIVYTGLLKSVEVRAGGIVSLTLGLDEQYRALRAECIRVVSALPGVSAVRVHMESVKIEPAVARAGAREKGVGGLAGVKTIVAVSSCKGGTSLPLSLQH
jgi:metal-sulfur cluster biosynthetic enzyme